MPGEAGLTAGRNPSLEGGRYDDAGAPEDLRQLIARLPVGLYQLRRLRDGGYRFDYVSPVFCQKIGLSAEELMANADAAFSRVHPDDIEDLLTKKEAGRVTLNPFEWEGRFLLEEQVHWAHMTCSPTLLANGDVLWQGIGTDITARKRSEQALTEFIRDFETFLEQTTDFVYFKDRHHRFRFCSQTVAKLTGHSSWRDLIGKGDLEVYPADIAKVFYEEELRIFAEGKPLLNKIDPYHNAGGELGYLQTSKWPVFDDRGKVVGMFGISRDITKRKLAEDALEAAKNEAERANNAKTRFIAAASHDLRQPIQALALYQQVLSQQIPEEARPVLEKAQACVASIMTQIEAITDLAKVDAGVMPMSVAKIAIQDVFDRLQPNVEPIAQAKGLRVRFLPSSAWVRTDGTLLERLLTNLVANAVKYTEHGRVLVGCRRRRGRLWVEVWDTGPGITRDLLDCIFTEYFRVEGTGQQGTGLGLATVDRIARVLGTRVTVRSEPGKGSVFATELPLVKP